MLVYLLNFELFFRSTTAAKNCKDRELANFKSELKNLGFSSLKYYNRRKKKLVNITAEEHRALNELLSYDDIIIQKSDKGNVIVIVNRVSYVEKMEGILSDNSKFTPKHFSNDHDDLKYILENEKKLKDFLSNLIEKGSITSEEFGKLCPRGSKPGILYGLCKIHKETVGDCPPFRPIVSAIDTSIYALAKFLVPILSPLTQNSYVVKDSFAFATDIRNQNPDLYMTSFDVESLYTNIPLDETINICVSKLFGRKQKFKGFSKTDFRLLLQYAVKDSLFIFNGNYYTQQDGVSMGSPLSPVLANIFLGHWEEIWLHECPLKFAPKYYKRYIDDTFVLFSSYEDVKKFHKFLNSRHVNMKFTYETEVNNMLPFLDVEVRRGAGKFLTSLYRKPTFSGLYTNYHSFISDSYKKGLIYTLLFRALKITVNLDSFQSEVSFLKNILKKNSYPEHFIERCVKLFRNNRDRPKVTPQGLQSEVQYLSLPFLGKYSNEIKRRVSSLASKYLVKTKVVITWNSPRKLCNMFAFKDKLPMHLRSKILYKFSCNGCDSVYYGKSVRHFLVRAYEHLGISLRTGKNFTYNPNNSNNSMVLNHLRLSEQCNGSLDNFVIIGQARNDYHLRIKESLLIKKFQPNLNNKVNSVPLHLFD